MKGGLHVSMSPWAGVLALFALYLLGPRRGLIFVAMVTLQVGLAFAVHHSDWSLTSASMHAPDSGLAVISNMSGIALIGLFGYLYELAQKRTLGELEDALISTEHNERQLEALIESSTAAICSIDTSLRLITCNHVFARLLARREEPRAGEELARVVPAAQMERWRPHLERILAGASSVTFEEPPDEGGRHRETTAHPVVSGSEVIGVTLFSRDITERKRAEAEMRRLHQELVTLSRQAGMATVAAEMLHNAGNVLNSVGVSVAMLETHVQRLKGGHLARTVALLDENAGHLDVFRGEDPRGRRVLDILRALGQHLEQQEQHITTELASLREGVDHLTRVVRSQQSHARSPGVVEEVDVDEVIEAAMALQVPPWPQLGVAVERPAADAPRLRTDRHKLLEILVNLLGNARHALRDSARGQAAGDPGRGGGAGARAHPRGGQRRGHRPGPGGAYLPARLHHQARGQRPRAAQQRQRRPAARGHALVPQRRARPRRGVHPGAAHRAPGARGHGRRRVAPGWPTPGPRRRPGARPRAGGRRRDPRRPGPPARCRRPRRRRPRTGAGTASRQSAGPGAGPGRCARGSGRRRR